MSWIGQWSAFATIISCSWWMNYKNHKNGWRQLVPQLLAHASTLTISNKLFSPNSFLFDKNTAFLIAIRGFCLNLLIIEAHWRTNSDMRVCCQQNAICVCRICVACCIHVPSMNTIICNTSVLAIWVTGCITILHLFKHSYQDKRALFCLSIYVEAYECPVLVWHTKCTLKRNHVELS